jgi:alginate O-acetyltransferase complex protein AlgI
MALGGLWHGASWTFVAWGWLHGSALAVDKFRCSFRDDRPTANKQSFVSTVRAALGWFTTIIVVLVGWVLFRAQSFSTAFIMLRKMFILEGGLHWVHPFVYVALLSTIVGHLTAEIQVLRRFRACDIRTLYGASVLLSMFLVALIYRPLGFQPFIYFQF